MVVPWALISNVLLQQSQPASVWVAEFLGLGNIITGKVLDERRVETSLGMLVWPVPLGSKRGEILTILIRPERVWLDAEGHDLKGCVKDVIFKREGYHVTLDSGLTFYSPTAPGIGEEVHVRVEAERLP